MFGDAADDDGSSPWASFTPKKPQRRSGAEVVRSLLADAEVPEAYVDAWEALAAGRRDVEEADVRRVVLEGSGVGAEAGERIWSIVSAGGESRVLGRVNTVCERKREEKEIRDEKVTKS
jgi:sorting nexin-8